MSVTASGRIQTKSLTVGAPHKLHANHPYAFRDGLAPLRLPRNAQDAHQARRDLALFAELHETSLACGRLAGKIISLKGCASAAVPRAAMPADPRNPPRPPPTSSPMPSAHSVYEIAGNPAVWA